MRTKGFSDKEKSLDDIVKIVLFGEEFKFKPDGRVEDSHQIAEYLQHNVDMAEALFSEGAPGTNKLAILLLAAMNISQDYHELKTKHAKFTGYVSQRTSSLIKKIEEGM